MKRMEYIKRINSLGLKKVYLANQVGAHPSVFSRWLHFKEKGNLSPEQVEKLNDLLLL